MSGLVVLTYVIGAFVAGTVFIARPGLLSKEVTGGANYREFLAPNPGWTLLYVFKTMFWPVGIRLLDRHPLQTSPWKATIQINGREVRKIQRVRAW